MKELMKKIALVLMIIPSCVTVTLLTSSTNLILEEYGAYPTALVTSLLTVPNLTVMIGLILSPMLIGKVSAKNLVIMGLGIYTAASVLPAFITNFYVFFLLRVLAGIGCGMILPMQATYVATYPEKQRATLMGITTSVVCLIAASLVAVSGYITAGGWRNVFWLYLVNLIPLVLSLMFLPANPVGAEEESAEQSAEEENSGVKLTDFMKELGIYYFLLTASYLVVSILGVELAPYMANTGLGDATSSGLLMSFSMLGSLVSGLVFSAYLNGLKKLAMPGIFLFSALGCACMWLAGSMAPVAAGVFIIGFFSAMIAVAINYELSLILPLHVYTGASAATNLLTFVLQFISPLVFLAVLNGAGGSFRTVFFIYMVFQLIMTPVALILTRNLKKA